MLRPCRLCATTAFNQVGEGELEFVHIDDQIVISDQFVALARRSGEEIFPYRALSAWYLFCIWNIKLRAIGASMSEMPRLIVATGLHPCTISCTEFARRWPIVAVEFMLAHSDLAGCR